MPSGQQAALTNPLKRPRQDPVSCQFCRTKKLKCDRRQPCSNCAARGLSCGGQTQADARAPLPADTEHLSILARLKRLEDIVIGKPLPEVATVQSSIPSTVQLGTADSQVSSPQISLSKSTSPLGRLSPASEYEEAVQSLEGTGIREPPWMPLSTNRLEFRILSTHQISVTFGASDSAHDKLPYGRLPSSYLCLPPKEEASLLLDHYIKYVEMLQHVTHVPTVRAMMESLYLSLEQGLPVEPSNVALLLSIFASAAGLYSYCIGDTQPLFSPIDAAQASLFWANAALEVGEFSRRTVMGRFEDVQAAIIMGFLLYHIEGFSARSRSLFAGAISIARDLSLHKLDAPNNRGLGLRTDAVEREVKRRAWWHVVATDWLLALSGGPQEGTYLIQPRHVRVNRPRNIDDDDLAHESPVVDRPLSEPTMMSYYIQRIRLADICRSVADSRSFHNLDLASIDYQEIIALDGKFETFFNELPPFFKTDERSRKESEPVMRRYPQMRIQRCALAMMGHSRRCKLHQPFLIRRSLDGLYDYSREISLKSAWHVIHTVRLVESERNSALAASIKHTGMLYHVFMAMIVLVMDLCFNKTVGNDAARKAEVAEACKILEESKAESRMASKFLESLMDILRKYKVRLYNPAGNGAEKNNHPQTGAASQSHDNMMVVGDQTVPSYQNTLPPQDNGQHYLSDFDEIWKEYVELGPNMDMSEWDNFFSDLDSRF